MILIIKKGFEFENSKHENPPSLRPILLFGKVFVGIVARIFDNALDGPFLVLYKLDKNEFVLICCLIFKDFAKNRLKQMKIRF